MSHPLEWIVDNPLGAMPAQILVALADPFEDIGVLSSIQRNDLVEALQIHFAHGSRLVKEMSKDLQNFEPRRGGYIDCEVGNAFELLNRILKKKPVMLDQRLGSLYKAHRASVESIADEYIKAMVGERDTINLYEKRGNIEVQLLLLLHYTHQWRHFVFKRDIQNPFSSLLDVSRSNVTVWLRANPEKDFPNYSSAGWLDRVKTADSAEKHFVRRTFEVMEEPEIRWGKDAFYNRVDDMGKMYGTDFFGVKIFGSGRNIMGESPQLQKSVEKFLGTYGWEVFKFEDKITSQDGLGPLIYLVRRKGTISGIQEMPDIVQLQLMDLNRFLLSDFFLKSHHVYCLRTERQLAGYKQRYEDLYKKLANSAREALSFLRK